MTEFLVRVKIGDVDGECVILAATAADAQIEAERTLPKRFRLKRKVWSIEAI